jgi:hypothetical protein
VKTDEDTVALIRSIRSGAANAASAFAGQFTVINRALDRIEMVQDEDMLVLNSRILETRAYFARRALAADAGKERTE